jgi:hydrogenase maturation protease
MLEPIVASKPEVVVFVDAMDLGLRPGAFRLLAPEETDGAISTHALSLRLAADYIRARCGADVRLLGIQPRGLELGSGASPPVLRAVAELAALASRVSPAARNAPGKAT